MYLGLDFRFADLQRELTNLQILASEFIAPASRQRLSDWARALDDFRRSERTQPWEWRTAFPIETISAKEYEGRGRGCTFGVHGEMMAVWNIQLRERRNSKHFRLLGKASTILRIIEDEAGEPPNLLAQWQIEIGDSQSPGCHFHVGVGQYDEAPLFPKGLSVPRLPGLLVTPTDALDFLLGELFQDRWARKAGQDSDAARGFGSPQKERMLRLLTWKLETLEQSSGSAWNHLKHARPAEPQLFFANA